MFRRLVVLSAALLGASLAYDEYNFDVINNSSDPSSIVGKVDVDTDEYWHNNAEATSDTYYPTSDSSTSTNHVQHKIRSGETPVRGVNLGSWLVAEKWMTDKSDIWEDCAANFSGSGEYLVMKYGENKKQRREHFNTHHNTFITESDIQAIAKTGINTIRVPVGWWILGKDPYDTNEAQDWKVFPSGTVKYLDKLIKQWALNHNVAVFISIHGAKGSQNGADHSAPTDIGQAYWSHFPENVKNTIYLAKFLADRYKDDAAFLGIGLLNEPNGDTDESVVNQYYQDAYAAVRSTGSNCILSIMPLLWKQDATNLNGFMEAPQYTNVWVEWHPYFIWGYGDVSADDLIHRSILSEFQNKVKTWNARPNSNKLFFGEWSLANSGQFPDENSAAFQQLAQAQITVMNQAKGGWTYWSWRVDGDDTPGSFNAWSMRNVLAKSSLRNILLGSADASQNQS